MDKADVDHIYSSKKQHLQRETSEIFKPAKITKKKSENHDVANRKHKGYTDNTL